MGLLDEALGRLRQAAAGTDRRETGDGDGGDLPPSPDPAGLVSAAEIREATGAEPQGTPRTNGDGMEVDIGRLLIWETPLSNGDEFLVTLSGCRDESAAKLGMDRMAEVEKPLAGVGERGLLRVKTYRKSGKSEVGVTARSGRYNLSLTHTSLEGRTDHEPLTELLRRALGRL